MNIKQPTMVFPWAQMPCGEHVIASAKTYESAQSFYASKDDSLPLDTVMYEVIVQNDTVCEGHLNFGLSSLNPVLVNGECNMTRGHFHEDLNCGEYYWCMAGTGYLMLMDENDACWVEEMKEGSLHYIQGTHAHRLINTGDDPLKVACCWNSNAGHDYARIDEHPFPVRVFKENGTIVFKEREHVKL